MNTSYKLPEQFKAVLDNTEEVIWFGNPMFLPFLASGVPFLIVGLIWGAIDFGVINLMQSTVSDTPINPQFDRILIPFFALHLAPFWLSILNMLRLMLVYGNTAYAITNKRVMMSSGFLGTDFKSIDHDKLIDIEVNVNPLENMFKVGTIKLNSGNHTSKGAVLYDSLIAIEKPYEVYKQMKTVSVDIKTDWNYPNKLRPSENPGYKTTYNAKDSV